MPRTHTHTHIHVCVYAYTYNQSYLKRCLSCVRYADDPGRAKGRAQERGPRTRYLSVECAQQIAMELKDPHEGI